ncbi:MAG: transcription initiation factor IIB [Candidatus Helarchaeota archaeon]
MAELRTDVSNNERIVCPECGNDTDIVNDVNRGEIICGNCGIVIDQRVIDQGPEWRAFTSDERDKRSRVGSPTSYTIHDKGLSTMIDWHDKDIYGKKLPPKTRAAVYRMRKWQIRTRVHSSIARNLAQAMAELDRLSSQLGIPKGVKETSAVMYRRAIERRLIRGRSIEAMVAASVYAACRIRKVPRTLDELAKFTRVSKKELGRSYRLMIQKLGISIPTANAKDFISRFGADLELSGRIQKKACELIDLATQKGITAGKDPTGLAAAAIYIVGILEGERRTQRKIAEVAHVTEVTIRNRYKELIKKLRISVEV